MHNKYKQYNKYKRYNNNICFDALFCPTGAKQYAPLGGSGPSDCDVAVTSQWSDKIGPISIIDTFDISGIICLMRVSNITFSAWVSFLRPKFQKMSLIR